MNQSARQLAQILDRCLRADSETTRLKQRLFSRPQAVLPLHQVFELATSFDIQLPTGSQWQVRTAFDESLRERGLVPPWSSTALSERRTRPELHGIQRSARALNQEHLDAAWRRFTNRK